ncbi:MAG: ferritin-like domain-containing protein [Flavobacteriales bacterium]|nr:ferritin-like domain-containing protein [Flavobacteriales bacterium]
MFEDQVADLYYAEKKLVTALKKMSGKASDKKLADAFLSHRQETEGQVERLEQVFGILGKKAKGKKCEAIEGLLKEAEEIMEDFKDDPALDAALVCAAQKVEHYEIGSYGCLVTYAEELGLMDAAKLLQATLKEEKGADEKLTKLAENSLNMAGEAHRTHKGGKSNGATNINKTKQTRTPSTVG